jgi:putative endonuclease
MPSSKQQAGADGERRVRLHFRLRGYRILDANVRAGGAELDLVARRGRRLVFAEVKTRAGDGYDARDAVGPKKANRLLRGAEAWLAARPELARLEVALELVAVTPHGVERLPLDVNRRRSA